MTFGTLSGMLLADEVLGRQNECHALYFATRANPVAGALRYLAENIDYPLHLVGDRLSGYAALDSLANGEGGIVGVNGKKLAVYKDNTGKSHAFSPICSHLGCFVHWNRAEKTWDCPCHGSRFGVDGQVLNGPATRGLQPMNLPSELKKTGS